MFSLFAIACLVHAEYISRNALQRIQMMVTGNYKKYDFMYYAILNYEPRFK